MNARLVVPYRALMRCLAYLPSYLDDEEREFVRGFIASIQGLDDVLDELCLRWIRVFPEADLILRLHRKHCKEARTVVSTVSVVARVPVRVTSEADERRASQYVASGEADLTKWWLPMVKRYGDLVVPSAAAVCVRPVPEDDPESGTMRRNRRLKMNQNAEQRRRRSRDYS